MNLSAIARLCETVAVMHTAGHRVVVVTSGAVGVGAQRLGLAKRPSEIPAKQVRRRTRRLYVRSHAAPTPSDAPARWPRRRRRWRRWGSCT